MVEPSAPIVDENGIPEVRTQDILKEGYLLKQSRYIKDWRRYFIHYFLNINHRRWFVLTKTHILSFKDEKVYKNPTEVIVMSTCQTVKSVEEEINK